MRSAVEQSVVVERAEDGDKEKKKKRRSNRRSKQNSGATCNTGNEARGEGLESVRSVSKTKSFISSMSYSSPKQQGLDMHLPHEQEPASVSNIAFSSMPPMHINEQPELGDLISAQSQNLSTDLDGRTFSKSCPEPVGYEGPPGSYGDGLLPLQCVESSSQRKIFSPHWSTEAVNDALKKGEAFRALFHVNAHNRFEAYCKIDGVPTDVLINGIAAQNRAVEGDIVVIKVDPLSLWTKMKGSNGSSNNSAQLEECIQLPNVKESAVDRCKGKGKGKVDSDNEHCKSGELLEKGFHDENVVEVLGLAAYKHVNGHHPHALDPLHINLSGEQNEVTNAVDRFAAMVSSFPAKRPTGTVLAIVEKSPRRDSVVGFLNVKQWLSYREFYKNDAKNKKCLSISDHEYVHLTPSDPRFPKMMAFMKDIPECIKKRLEDSDATIEMELVSAQISGWTEESLFPQASVSHVFGKAGELEPHIKAILYENAIHPDDFSPESISCLPQIPWEVPQDEIDRRKDLRNLCVFTIDPSTATDLDDALSVERLSDGIFRVGVHIADVSYFALPGTPLDSEAQVRATSVYMLQKKLPMLPPLLSENVASLNPGVNRLAFSIFWDLSSTGDIIDRWIGRTVIRSCCKLSYEQAQRIIDGMFEAEVTDESGCCPQLYGHFEWADVIKSVKSLREISKILKERRFKDGALQLESSRVIFSFDDYGVPYGSMLSERIESNLLVEEFMLLANTTAAEVISRAFPDCALLRRHPEPNLRKLKELENFCVKHGLELDASSSGQFHRSLEKLKEKLKDDSVLFDILTLYALKAMQLAMYFCSGELKDNVNEWGHYALAVPLYTHFTSPLRRYPDIVVHRTLSAVIEAEELYLKKVTHGEELSRRCFTGICFDKDAAESNECREALSTAAMKHKIPCTELLANVAAYCNDRKLASRHVKDACDKLYMWFLLKKRERLLSEARVLGLGPRFMSIYIQELAIERRINYDEVDGLIVEWLESTSTLVLNLSAYKRSKRGGPGHYRPLDEVALIVKPYDLSMELGRKSLCECGTGCLGDAEVASSDLEPISKSEIHPGTFPLTLRLLSTIPVALDAVRGEGGPLDIRVRLYMSSYLR